MGPLLGLLTASMGGSLVYLIMFFRSRERAEAWQRAARAAGLTSVQASGSMGFNSRLTGLAGPLRVRLESYQHGKNESGTRIVVGGLRHGSYALTIRPEGIGTAIEKTVGERETEVGDEAFDNAAYLQGEPALIHALFDADTRRLMRRLLLGQLRVEGPRGATELRVRAGVSDSELRVEIRESLFGGTLESIPAVLVLMVDLGKRLMRPDDLAAAIAANTSREPLPAVRLANLQLLARQQPTHPATRTTLLAGLGDDNAAVRLQAAISVGPEGHATLQEFTTREDVSDGIAARAIMVLGQEFPCKTAIIRLRRAREVGQSRTARACVDVIGKAGTGEAIETLVGVLAASQEELAVAAANGLGTTPSEESERALVAALDHEAAAVRVAAAEALGRIGSPQAVASLRECAATHRFDGTLRRATRHAIVEIQARVTGASPGQLSLAAGDAGQVSLADEDQRGRVSLEPDGGTAPASDGSPTSPTRSP
jgi:hypothetical protein